MRLRLLLFAAMSGIAVLPVAGLAIWTFMHAVDKEFDGARDKHLVIARNVGKALERYSVDLANALKLVAGLDGMASKAPGIVAFIRQLELVHFCVADIETGVVDVSIGPADLPCPERVPAERLQFFRSLLDGDEPAFSPVVRSPQGEPVIYLLWAQGGRLAIGAVSTAYIVRQGEAVAFGEKGHAAIVDHLGNVIAHPKTAWRHGIRNLSAVSPVQRMMAGETGVTTFYSPALKADMITGYTYVPTTGWGVMVPQPISEIRAEAATVRYRALGFSILGIAAAALLSWYISGLLARPLASITAVARRMAGGDLAARVENTGRLQLGEALELGHAFNAMADGVGAANRAMAEAAEQANRASNAKSEFLACMSHDLRTPLNAIIGFADAMRTGAFGPLTSERSRGYLDDILRSGNVLLGLINDILDLSKIEAGNYELSETPVDLIEALGTAMDLAGVMARQKSVELSLSASESMPRVLCDPRCLSQVLANLLSNAIKFSHEGGHVRISCDRAADGALTMAFADDGIGVRPADLERLVRPFTQAASHRTRQREGTGLGLYICRKIIDLHGGSLSIESTFGQGTTVTVRFPADRALAEPTGSATRA